MSHRTFRNRSCLSVVLLLFVFGMRPAHASDIPVSGSYEVIQKTDLGSQAKVLVRFHLTNHGTAPLSVQEVLLSDFAHPPGGGPVSPPVLLPPGISEEVSQELVIPQLQLDRWRRGLLPRVILELRTASGARISQAIRLEQVSAGKGK
jgi:hypothetical protein